MCRTPFLIRILFELYVSENSIIVRYNCFWQTVCRNIDLSFSIVTDEFGDETMDTSIHLECASQLIKTISPKVVLHSPSAYFTRGALAIPMGPVVL